jgi:hypothetical protein
MKLYIYLFTRTTFLNKDSTPTYNNTLPIYFVQSAIYNNNLEWLDLSGTQISKLSFLKHL